MLWKLRTENAVGDWQIQGEDTFLEFKPSLLGSGILMVLVGVGTAAMAKWKWRISWRWLWCGALLWVIAVAVKILIAFLLNKPLLGALKNLLPNPLYLILGSSYLGLLTGLTEVAITLAAGLIWRRLALDARRAVGIGLGAGAIEAALLGLGALAASVTTTSIHGIPSTFSATLILAPVIERLSVIPCHAAARVMALYTVATRRWLWFWAGFGLLSAIDAVAGFYHLMNWPNAVNPWLLELPLIVFPVLSIPILQYLCRHWPPQASGVVSEL